MGSSNRGFLPSSYSSGDMKKDLAHSTEATNKTGFDVEVSSYLDKLLIQANDRPADKVNERIGKMRQVLEEDIDGTIDMNFGGSYKKHTYVDGLSDIDSLIILNKSELADKTPDEIREYIASNLTNKISGVKEVIKGALAVTIKFTDDMEIQLLPALKTNSGIKIASSDGQSWDKINPKGFTDHLTQVNQLLNGKLVPVIKLIKYINSQFPTDQQLKSYHIESLAIAALKNFQGEKTSKALTEEFFIKSKDLVLAPIKDKTNQNIHVDDYLGGKNSKERKGINYRLEVVAKKIKKANELSEIRLWRGICGE